MSRSEWNKISQQVICVIEAMTTASEASGGIDDRIANTCIAILIGLAQREGCPEVYRVFVGNLKFTGKWGELEISSLKLLKSFSEVKLM